MDKFTDKDLEEALRQITSVVNKIKKAQEHFAQGTPQHTLAKNRLKAFHIASLLITESLEKR